MAARTTAHVTEVPAPRSTRSITCANHKGGTGKTTTAVNVSAGLALLTQQRVLLIDCDPRGHASLALGIDTKHVRYSVTDLLMGAKPEVQALCWHPGGFCRKFCSEGHDGAVTPVCAEITRRESRTVRPQ
jgi:chromosome partitioning protein